MSLMLEPVLLIADEAVSALDVSVQAQVLDLLEDVKEKFDLAMLFITHDLRVAAQICDRIMVMQKGIVVESGPTAQVFANHNTPTPVHFCLRPQATARLAAKIAHLPGRRCRCNPARERRHRA
jgi:ABC-type dipeptide/oligopeptide/nickel transport system ATPase component